MQRVQTLCADLIGAKHTSEQVTSTATVHMFFAGELGQSIRWACVTAVKCFCTTADNMQGHEGSEDGADCMAEGVAPPHRANFYRTVARTFAKQARSCCLWHCRHVHLHNVMHVPG